MKMLARYEDERQKQVENDDDDEEKRRSFCGTVN